MHLLSVTKSGVVSMYICRTNSKDSFKNTYSYDDCQTLKGRRHLKNKSSSTLLDFGAPINIIPWTFSNDWKTKPPTVQYNWGNYWSNLTGLTAFFTSISYPYCTRRQIHEINLNRKISCPRRRMHISWGTLFD